jgi:hypothetical protein
MEAEGGFGSVCDGRHLEGLSKQGVAPSGPAGVP